MTCMIYQQLHKLRRRKNVLWMDENNWARKVHVYSRHRDIIKRSHQIFIYSTSWLDQVGAMPMKGEFKRMRGPTSRIGSEAWSDGWLPGLTLPDPSSNDSALFPTERLRRKLNVMSQNLVSAGKAYLKVSTLMWKWTKNASRIARSKKSITNMALSPKL